MECLHPGVGCYSNSLFWNSLCLSCAYTHTTLHCLYSHTYTNALHQLHYNTPYTQWKWGKPIKETQERGGNGKCNYTFIFLYISYTPLYILFLVTVPYIYCVPHMLHCTVTTHYNITISQTIPLSDLHDHTIPHLRHNTICVTLCNVLFTHCDHNTL
jgi:hypothetical protein